MADAIFVNKAESGLITLLSNISPEAVKNGIAGTSSEFFKSLAAEKQVLALKVIVSAIDQV